MRYFYRHGIDMPLLALKAAVLEGRREFMERIPDNHGGTGWHTVTHRAVEFALPPIETPPTWLNAAAAADLVAGELITIFSTDAHAVELEHRGFIAANWICGYDSGST